MTLSDDAKNLTREECLKLLPWEYQQGFARTPFTHQLQALVWAVPQKAVPLFMEMGTGKSGTVIEWLRWHKITNKILIITVNFPLAYNWVNEFEMTYPSLNGIVLQGTKEERQKLIKTPADFYVINFAGLSVIWNELYERKWDALVIDESRRIKSMRATRTQLCLELGKKIEHRAILSGLPTVNPMDIFPQYLFIDRGETFGHNFYKFRNKFFKDKGWKRFHKWVIKPEMESEFKEKLDSKCFRIQKSEALDLPKKIKQKLYIQLTQTQMGDYMKLVEGDGDLDIGQLTPKQISNCFIKYSQITGGFLRDKAGEDKYYERNPKIETLIDLVKDAIYDTKVTIFHRFVAEGRQIEEALKEEGIKYASMRSEIKDTTAEYDKFKNDPAVRAIVAHPQSGGIGLNFTNSALCIFYSLDFDIEYKLQAEDRLHRIGQENAVTYIHLIARHTIDEEIWKAQAEGIGLIARINSYKMDFKTIVKGEGIRWKEPWDDIVNGHPEGMLKNLSECSK